MICFFRGIIIMVIKMDIRMRKYADLLLKCVRAEDKRYLFIDIPNFLSDFKDILLDVAKDYNLDEVYVYETDPFVKHDLMKKLDQENINKHPMFNKSIFNKYAKLDAAFIFIESMVPDLMSDIDPEKIKNTGIHIRSTQKYFRDLYEGDKLNWLIAGVPNEYWAKDALDVSLDDFWELLYSVCLVDYDNNPYKDWCNRLDDIGKRTDKLNEYNFKYLRYRTDKGTDLTVYLPEGHIWHSGKEESGCIVNLPTEEIFTSPQYDKIDGIVYSTKPLVYNNVLIDEFYFKLEHGKVVEYGAYAGKDVLEGILTTDDFAGYFGECALVQVDSPINNTGTLFYNTLYDENASCHFALGRGFNNCNKNEADDIRSIGINDSKVHVDFMIGDETLSVVGVTYDDKEIDIIKNGNFVI